MSLHFTHFKLEVLKNVDLSTKNGLQRWDEEIARRTNGGWGGGDSGRNGSSGGGGSGSGDFDASDFNFD